MLHSQKLPEEAWKEVLKTPCTPQGHFYALPLTQLFTNNFSIFRGDRCWELHCQTGLLTQGQSCYEDMSEKKTIPHVTKLI